MKRTTMKILLFALTVMAQRSAPFSHLQDSVRLMDGESHDPPGNCTLDNHCENNGKCRELAFETTACICFCGYSGPNCTVIDTKHKFCNETGNCNKHGECKFMQYVSSGSDGSYKKNCSEHKKCHCHYGYAGDFCEEDTSKCWDPDNLAVCQSDKESDKNACAHNKLAVLCSNNGYCLKNKDGIRECSCKHGFSGYLCEKVGTETSQSKWEWGSTVLIIVGLLTATVLLERIWTCGRKTMIRLQGREGFRRVPADDDDDDDDRRQLDEFGGSDIGMTELKN
mmetsp:Transcript_19687/g.29396  ORF Transcript_19687/g.29396 Transcript_19687/m.29396 type:complete len:281 (-) Transcript_19687:139-981(-)